jgi:hypothetical protein
VVAFHSPATIEDTCCSPNAISVHGIALNDSATTAQCSHRRRSDGSRSRRTATRMSKVRAPSPTRPNETHSAGQCLASTLMNRKLDPQIAASAAN